MNNNISVCYSCESCICSDEWTGLCSFDCYQKMSQLLIPFEYADTMELHPKLVKYFLKYHDRGNFYMSSPIKRYLKNISKCHFDIYLKEGLDTNT